MDSEFIAPGIMLVIVITYYLVARKHPKDESSKLFMSIIHDGCQHCGGNFTVITPRTLDAPNCLTLQCDDCEKQYQINHHTREAWAK